MNCIVDFGGSAFSSEKKKSDFFAELERSHVVVNAMRKLAIEGPEADILDEALLYRELMKKQMNGLPQGKEGPDDVYLFLYTRLKVDHFPTRIDLGLRFNDEGVKKEFSERPEFEYSEAIKGYLKERRQLTKHIIPPHLPQNSGLHVPSTQPE